jgi:hypothetical protein
MKTTLEHQPNLALLKLLTVLAATLIISAGAPVNGAEQVPRTSDKPRIGIYDSRAVALAFYRSDQWKKETRQHMADYEKAKAAGDKKREAELRAWGEGGQDRAHRQVFGEAPIDNILMTMSNALPRIQKQAGVQSLGAKPPKGTNAEVVDVTPLLVEQFHPTPETLKLIEDIKKQPPLSDDKFPIKD